MRNLLDKFAPLRGAPQKPEVAHASGADLAPVVALLTRSLHLSGQIAARNLPRNAPIGKLCDVEFRVSSQWGEDGILEWLINHVEISRTKFVEFGVEDFREANCRFLMEHRSWKGLVIDSSADHIAALHGDDCFWRHHLVAKVAFITRDNINDLIAEAGFGGRIGLLSVDVDGNDYWILEAIQACQADIIVCEYNSEFGDKFPIAIPYSATFCRFDFHHSGLYLGASLPALQLLAKKKGYVLVGTNSHGSNAFFVKKSLAQPVLDLLGEVRSFPDRMRISRSAAGGFVYHDNHKEMRALIGHLPLINVESGETTSLNELGEVHSDEWLEWLC